MPIITASGQADECATMPPNGCFAVGYTDIELRLKYYQLLPFYLP